MYLHHQFSNDGINALEQIIKEKCTLNSILLVSNLHDPASVTLGSCKGEISKFVGNYGVAVEMLFYVRNGAATKSLAVRNTNLYWERPFTHRCSQIDNAPNLIEGSQQIYELSQQNSVLFIQNLNIKVSRVEVYNLTFKGPFTEELTVEEDAFLDEVIIGTKVENLVHPSLDYIFEDDTDVKFFDLDVDIDLALVLYDDEAQRRVIIGDTTITIECCNGASPYPIGTFFFPYPRLRYSIRKEINA